MMRSPIRWLAFLACLVALTPALAGDFPRPAELEPDIRFWTRVYSEVGTDGGLIHDSRHLGVVYEVVEFPTDARRHERRKQVRAAKQRYREILRTLAGGKRDNLSQGERQVLALWPDDVDNDTLRAAAHRIRFQLGQADRFRAGLIRSGAWESHIRETFAELDLPEQLVALPHVESSFNPEARSHVGAAGLWQFTRSTGRRFMRIDHVIDERMDPYRSTRAAAKLLKHNYSVTGSWPLAITAYNHGAAGMRRAARQVGTDDIARIVREYRSRTFGFASRNFYVAFLAALDVHRHAQRHFGELDRDEPPPTETVELEHYTRASAVAEALGVSTETLRRYNPALERTVWEGQKYVPKGFALRVPEIDEVPPAAQRLASLDPSQQYARQRPDRYHRVRRGHTLSMIASRYDVSVRELMSLNNLRSAHFIRVGQRLRLPVPPGAAEATVASAEPPEDGTYRVRRGDTIWEIAQRFDVDQDRIISANGLEDGTRIHPGETLRVAKFDAAKPAAEPTAEARAPLTETAAKAKAQADAQAVTEQAQTEAIEEAEPTTAQEAETLGPALPAATHPDLSADPSDYEVADNGTIEVQAAETLGHYAEWLGLRASQLRRINGMRYGQPVVIGHRLELDFSEVEPTTFVRRRMAYHQLIQEAFFRDYEIAGTEVHVVRPGDSLWSLARRKDNVPVWLLRQYNPDLEFDNLRPGSRVTVPQVDHREAATPKAEPAQVSQS